MKIVNIAGVFVGTLKIRGTPVPIATYGDTRKEVIEGCFKQVRNYQITTRGRVLRDNNK